MNRIVISLAMAGILACATANADVIYLKNGGRVHGLVIRDNGKTVTIDIGNGTVVHNRQDILRIEEEGVEIARTSSSGRIEIRDEKGIKHIRAPRPKTKFSQVVEAVGEAIGSVLRLDFLKRSK